MMKQLTEDASDSDDSVLGQPMAIVPRPTAQPDRRGVRFDSSSSDDEQTASIPIHARGPSGMVTKQFHIPKVSSHVSLAHVDVPTVKSIAEHATPHVTHEQLKYKSLAQRSSATIAPPSRPDAPDIEDSLRRISVVLLQHITRGERAAAGINVAETTPPSMRHKHHKSEQGGLAGLLERFAVFSQSKKETPTATPTTSNFAINDSSDAASDLRERLLSDSSDDEVVAAAPAPREVDTPEALYDAEVEEDDFHEARYIKPEYNITYSNSGFFGLFFSEYSIQRVRYTFTTPSSAEIYGFMKKVFSRAKLTAESCIVSLIYVERLMESGRIFLRAHNWRPIVLCGLLLASKVWDDLNSWSVEFAAIYPQYTVHVINTMERLFVSKIGFNLFISGSVYARYYFALRALNEQKSFRQRYNNLVAAPGAPVAMVKRIEQNTKGLRDSIYSRSF